MHSRHILLFTSVKLVKIRKLTVPVFYKNASANDGLRSSLLVISISVTEGH